MYATAAIDDTEARALLAEYPMLARELTDLGLTVGLIVLPVSGVELHAEREPLFIDGHDCQAARTCFNVVLRTAAVADPTPWQQCAPLQYASQLLRRWWARFLPPSEVLGTITLAPAAPGTAPAA